MSNVSLVAPSPIKFVIDGAEHLLLGLQRYANDETRHACELLKIPTREGSLLEIVWSYRDHLRVDLSSFDQVITTKYPAWMTCHANHLLYMLHTLRGLFDIYHFCRLPVEAEWTVRWFDGKRSLQA